MNAASNEHLEKMTMETNLAKSFIIELLTSAGITPNGPQPWDIQINNELFYKQVLREHALALGESYMDGWWDCARLDDFFFRIIRGKLESKLKKSLRLLFKLALAKVVNFQTKKRAKQVGLKHYNLGYDLFHHMLDSRMNYTCGYWKNADTLDQAQLNKLDLVCKKLQLKPGMRFLDIGCGWGGLIKYAAENYGVNAVGITISQHQYEYAKKNCAGLPVEVRLQDYRDLKEKFDCIASLGMFEHVGHLNYRTYMQIAYECLIDNGLFLLHTIGSDVSTFKANEWISKYIFPNGMIPSISQFGEAEEGLFIMEDWHNFGADYDKTLIAWHNNFEKNWPEIQHQFDQRFYRMWNYYLLSCAGAFRARDIQLWQIVLSKKGVIGGYQAPR
jgi:cyclopropane-fatty-acyl-phospholipid synthase